MAPIYADRPFAPIPTPMSSLAKGEVPDDFTNIATEMACVHNFIIRGLNAIYLQAPHIPTGPTQQAKLRAFLNFCQQWHFCLAAHHRGEEDTVFPTIEARTGVEGLMDGNKAQHAAFEHGITELGAYIERCLLEPREYDGSKIVAMIDSFGETLQEHLADEIPTLLSLRDHADKLEGFRADFTAEGRKHQQDLGLFKGVVCPIVMHDVEFEGGVHTNFPPAPPVALWIMRNVLWWAHRDWWQFAPCDRHGRLRDLSCNIVSEDDELKKEH